jgi:hypothetical protein
MKRLSHHRWTEDDKDQLRELASKHISDIPIARIMGRTPTAVSWQRRYLRIRLAGNTHTSYSAVRRSFNIVPIRTDKPKVEGVQADHSRIDKMMELASGLRMRLSA